MTDFIGVKIALLTNADRLLVIQRDNKSGLQFAGLWDFPGGGREDKETPLECVTRELKEELSIQLSQSEIIWNKHYPTDNPSLVAYFMVSRVTDDQIKGIRFGDEGRGWKLMTIEEFLQANDVVQPLKIRLQDYLATSRN